MRIEEFLNAEEITDLAKKRFKEERATDHLEGWFLAKEIQRKCDAEYASDPDCIRIARTEVRVAQELPLWLSDYHIFAGTQDDAFARSYALINPSFRVEDFNGYCDPVAIFGDIDPIGDITQERIDDLKEYNKHTKFAQSLVETYDMADGLTEEAVFFIEQVSGHLIPDVRPILKSGIRSVKERIAANKSKETDQTKLPYYDAMDISLDACLTYAGRYADLAHEKAAAAADRKDRARFELMEKTLRKVPYEGADDLYEAIQSFIIVWQTMCMEQTPNPYAFSVGNADRIFEPYRAAENTDRDTAAALFKHLLVFFNVADRSWAISQNLLVGGKSTDGRDLTNPSTYALLDAYYDMNLPQPILSVKLHRNTPDKLYEEMGRFFFTPGCLTPSLFNDDSVQEIERTKNHVDEEDLEDIAVAGCQEPLIMGKDNGNTTNSWLNLGKILELSVNGGVSELSGKRYGRSDEEMGYTSKLDVLKNIRTIFYDNVRMYTDKMAACANAASRTIGILQVPFLSTMMGGVESGIDARDPNRQGTKYNASGCLIHGLSVVADSFIAIDTLVKERPQDADRMVEALRMLHKTRQTAVRSRRIALQMINDQIVSAPEELRDQLRGMTRMQLIRHLVATRPDKTAFRTPDGAARISLKHLAKRYVELDDEVSELDDAIAAILADLAPKLIALPCVGPQTASQLMITVGDNPGRIKSEASFAMLCGVAPIPVSTGMKSRHRLNRGGDRAANSAIHIIAVGRLRTDERTRAFVDRKMSEGHTKTEAIRCLKRYIAREVYYVIKEQNRSINSA